MSSGMMDEKKVVKRFLECAEALRLQLPRAKENLRLKKRIFHSIDNPIGIGAWVKNFFYYEKARKEFKAAENRVEFILMAMRAHSLISKMISRKDMYLLEAAAMLLKFMIRELEANQVYFEDIPHSSSNKLIGNAKELLNFLEETVCHMGTESLSST